MLSRLRLGVRWQVKRDTAFGMLLQGRVSRSLFEAAIVVDLHPTVTCHMEIQCRLKAVSRGLATALQDAKRRIGIFCSPQPAFDVYFGSHQHILTVYFFMNQTPVRVAVTGAAGHIGYSLVFRIASGALFGPQQPVILHLIEIEPALPALGGVVMELDDCAFPLLKGIVATANLDEGFRGVNWALLVGSVPRKAGMERKDLLGINGKIFIGQGQAIQKNAASDVRIHVVGNPCNTNSLIAMNNAPDVPRERFFAMTRLDENRAKAQLAKKVGVDVTAVTNVAIWGNHSATQYPDFTNAKINGKPATDVIKDEAWLKGEFISTVQQRGAAIIKARGASSAASAASAVIDSVRSIAEPTAPGDWHSVCLCSDGSYGVEKGLISSFPVRSDGKKLEIVQGVTVGDFSRTKIDATVNELKEERALVADLLPK